MCVSEVMLKWKFFFCGCFFGWFYLLPDIFLFLPNIVSLASFAANNSVSSGCQAFIAINISTAMYMSFLRNKCGITNQITNLTFVILKFNELMSNSVTAYAHYNDESLSPNLNTQLSYFLNNYSIISARMYKNNTETLAAVFG